MIDQASPQARDSRRQLLERVVEHMLATGTATASLRSLAAEVGTSHRMLIYHFGGQPGLIQAVVEEVEARQRAALARLGADLELSAADLSLAFWRRLSSPRMRSVERLFFQLYMHLIERGDHQAAVRLSTAWHEPVIALLVARGYRKAEARIIARLGIAATRGLLLDLIASGDKRSADAAAKLYIASVFGPGGPGARTTRG